MVALENRVISLSGKKGCGKSLVATQIGKLTARKVIGHADPIKDLFIAAKKLDWEDCYGKSSSREKRGARSSLRTALNFFRDNFGEDFWANYLDTIVSRNKRLYVISDLRFKEEYFLASLRQDLIIRIFRKSEQDNHYSETHLDDYDWVQNPQEIKKCDQDHLEFLGYSKINERLYKGSRFTPFSYLLDNNGTERDLILNVKEILNARRTGS